MTRLLKHILPALLIFLLGGGNALAGDIASENLKYRVMYKWGLINKRAGTVTIHTSKVDAKGVFNSTLIGHSAKWADKFFAVRDTLRGTIIADGIHPLFYEKISHEGGEYKHDIITYERHPGGAVTAHCDRYKQKKKSNEVEFSEKELQASGYTVDMLSAFYYMRYMDFPNMTPGEHKTMNIFSGKRKEILKITYQGTETISLDKKDYDCYHITFSFTSDGKKKSSDDLQAWIETGANRVPVKMEGKLPVGSVKCFLEP
ncbi:MAG: DUF3108 domain-containing protein [Muribaculaceae bacterium]|nr:DUF3108 domain-containing protein [Muribaculaceae bacterium]